MAANINGTFDFTTIILKLIDSTYGIVFFSIVVFLLISGYVISILLKSGVVSSFTTFSDHWKEQRNKQIVDQEKLLNDEFLKEFSTEINYHIKASKLSNYLNIKNKDLDLLTYILSCRNKERAVRLYKIGRDYLEKDEVAGLYKLKKNYTEKKIKLYSTLGTVFYVLINFIGLSPFMIIQYFRLIYRHNNLNIPNDLYSSMFYFFIVFFIIALMVLWKFLKPTAAKNFLEIEKISSKKTKSIKSST